jgi:NADH:ubiquinone oxidoreductase subunit 3 (subunit A)
MSVNFEPYEDARHVIDVKFVLTAILFIVFDIEIMFLVH